MITVLGATGYIGSNLLKRLVSNNIEVFAPGKEEIINNRNLGHIIYCIGMTADFRTKPFETVEAHVCVLNKILRDCQFESLTYLSSTRIYINSIKDLAEEHEKILIDPFNADELYTLTKLTGERLCLSSKKNVKIVRLANVFGDDFNSDNFLSDIVRKILSEGTFTLHSPLASSKDYLFIDDAVDLLIKIALTGKEKIYNLASGKNTTNQEIINKLKNHINFSFTVADNAKLNVFPKICVKKINAEFNFIPQNITTLIPNLLKKHNMYKIDIESKIIIDEKNNVSYPLGSKEGFKIISDIWLKSGWEAKYVYSFAWMGRPVIQLPEDMIRIQEIIFNIKPDVIIETGIAHGGSLIFYASLCKAMEKGRVIGIDIEIRAHNRKAIEEHFLYKDYIEMVEGSSTAPTIIEEVKSKIKEGETVLVILDSNHTKQHVLDELKGYASMVTVGSYIVATDGIMEMVKGLDRTGEDWEWNNPKAAAIEFADQNSNFIIEEPQFPFNESIITDRITYWPSCYIKRIS